LTSIELRNRFAIVKGVWEDHLPGVAYPPLGDGTAAEKIQRLEFALVDSLYERAEPQTAEQAADAMWSLVHTRSDTDVVKLRVMELHEALARLSHQGLRSR